MSANDPKLPMGSARGPLSFTFWCWQHRRRELSVAPAVGISMKHAVIAILGSVLFSATDLRAAEIKILCPAAMRAVMTELIPQFEKSSGHEVSIEYGTVGAIIARLKAGDAIDVAIVTDKQLPDLTKQGLILADGQAVVAKVGLGVFVRKGEAKPAINSLDEFKKTLLAAKSVVYGDPKLGDSSGIAAEAIFERLGIAAEMKPKAKLVAAGAKGETVIKGDADIGFDQMSNIVINPKIESLGPLPATLQNYTDYAGGLVTAGRERDAGKAFVGFLRSSAAQAVMKSKGFEGL
jgi:molybdate transport system substrate-binding protein